MIPTRIGQRVESGTFAGIYRNVNTCVGVIVAPTKYDKPCMLDCNNKFQTALASKYADNYVKTITVDGYSNWQIPNLSSLCVIFLNLTNRTPPRTFTDYCPRDSIPSVVNETRKVYVTRYTTVGSDYFYADDHGSSTVRLFKNPMEGIIKTLPYETYGLLSFREGDIWFSKPGAMYSILPVREINLI